MAEPDWSQYEAVVDKRWDYYRPRFERFARGGWLSWNWSAFFGTQAWLEYRKLRGWSWAYFLLSTPILFAAIMIAAATSDACEHALDPMAGSVARAVALGLMALGWLLPPLVADRIYYNRVRDLAAQVGPGAGTSAFGRSGALVLQAFVVGLTVLSSASYATYIYRSMASEGISMAAGAKTPFEEHLADRGRPPAKIGDILGTTSGRYVDRMELSPEGGVKAVFGERGRKLNGFSVSFVPTLKEGRVVEWSCRSDLPNQCLPASCRR